MGPTGSSAVWLARSVRDAEAAGSNPAFPTELQDKLPGKSLRKFALASVKLRS